MNIYGNHINLETPDDDAIIVDVVVIARSLRTSKDGRMEDAVLVSSTDSTTGIIFDGMLSAVTNGEYVEVDDD